MAIFSATSGLSLEAWQVWLPGHKNNNLQVAGRKEARSMFSVLTWEHPSDHSLTFPEDK